MDGAWAHAGWTYVDDHLEDLRQQDFKMHLENNDESQLHNANQSN